MNVYLISLVNADPIAWEILSKQWPDRHHIVNDRLAFVAPSGVSTAVNIREELGITTDRNAPSGVVVPLDSHSGVLATKTVEWLRSAQHE